MRSRFATMVLLVSTTGVNGCGGEGDRSFSVPLQQFPGKISEAICAQNFKCCSGSDINGRTLQQCLNDNSAAFSLTSSAISSGQAKGRIAYDGAEMGTCISAVEKMTCAEWQGGLSGSNEPTSCKAAVLGMVAVGGACQQDEECMAGKCEGANSSTTPPTDGRCAALAAAGASCAGGLTCVDGFVCHASTQFCVAKKTGGEACTRNDECVNGCNTDTGLCSCYVGCAVGVAVSPPATLLSLALLGAAILIGRGVRRRRPRQC